jgi:hypothetical protein
MTLRYSSPLLLLVLLVAGCSAATGGGTVARGGLDRIEREEILAANRGNAYELLEMVRPQWLRMRSATSINITPQILVYVDEVRYGPLESLRTLSTREIYVMQRYNTTAASQRWGPGHSEGVIAISTMATSIR